MADSPLGKLFEPPPYQPTVERAPRFSDRVDIAAADLFCSAWDAIALERPQLDRDEVDDIAEQVVHRVFSDYWNRVAEDG